MVLLNFQSLQEYIVGVVALVVFYFTEAVARLVVVAVAVSVV